jgi:ATP-dependent Clp protease ATP-binding subunit ClpA
MFERFTDRSRRVVVLAQEEARVLDHNYIGPEHILLGLIHEGQGVAAKALEGLGLSLDAVRQQVEEIIGRGQQPKSGHIPFTPRAKRVLELSLREAHALGHDYIGTEHILLGILREGDSVAAQVLVAMGTDLNRVRQEVVRLLAGRAGEGSPAAGVIRETRLARPGAGQDFQVLRDTLASMAERIAAIERHLGLNAGAQEPGGAPAGEPEGPGSGETAPGSPGNEQTGPPGDKPDEPPGDVSAAGE